MHSTRRSLIQGVGAAIAAASARTASAADMTIQSGPFSPDGTSLEQYRCPDWFRDAKFGIWAHWGPQSVPGVGDWYARNMYIEGHKQYQYHVKTYGHPSKFGFKDVIPLWKAERFDPKALMKLYREAGAKYFVTMGVHCDNFDLWNSRHHRWNAVKMGPRKDIVGLFRDAARAEGLRFGVTEHVWGSYNWFATNKGSDKQGPYAGVPYDGSDPANYDLYHPPHPIAPKAWAEQGNESDAWKQEWFLRVRDLIDNYQPDLMYTDGAIAFGRWGRSLVAHLYNQSLRRHGGKVDVVYTSKKRADCASGTCVLDIERGLVDDIWPQPWQTDTCIGSWHYNREVRYKTPKTVIDLLVDIVSRNGNLLLNFPLPGSGALDDEELRILAAITAWMRVNAEGIHGTRPWKIAGEGPGIRKTATGEAMIGTPEHFNERGRVDLTAADFRFTTKGENTLYAFSMGWNPKETVIGALSSARGLLTREIARVDLLGTPVPLKWRLAEDGLHIESPAARPSDYAVAFKVVCA
jgi:alpha-L-fucosidase